MQKNAEHVTRNDKLVLDGKTVEITTVGVKKFEKGQYFVEFFLADGSTVKFQEHEKLEVK